MSLYIRFIVYALTQLEAVGISLQVLFETFVAEQKLNYAQSRDLGAAISHDFGKHVNIAEPAIRMAPKVAAGFTAESKKEA